MKTFTPYNPQTGLFLNVQLDLADSDVAINTPPGCLMMEGAYDHLAVQIDVSTGNVVERTIPPADTGATEWIHDAIERRWKARPNAIVRGMKVRTQRDKLLKESDAAVVRSSERKQPLSKAWEDYRQALRDLPTRPDFPDIADWPAKPPTL